MVVIMAGMVGRHQQIAYIGLQKSLHKEWDFVQHTNSGICKAFHLVEDNMRDAFPSALFKGSMSQILRRAVNGPTTK